MKKILTLLFGVLVGLPAISQTQQLAEVLRIWKRIDIPVQDGTTYKFKVYRNADSARYFDPGLDTLEATITFKKKTVVPLPDIISTLDDNTISAAQVYNPTTNLGDNVYQPTTAWTHMKNQPWNQKPDGTPIHYNKTVSIVELAGAYVEVTCTCYKIEWWGEKRVNHGIVSIQLDGGAAVDYDTYDPRTDNNSLLIYTTPASITTNGQRKLRVNYTGRKNTSSTSTNIVHDKFVIYTKQ